MNSICTLCSKDKTHYLDSKPVCLRCDELLFDIEIECEEIKIESEKLETQEKSRPTSRIHRR